MDARQRDESMVESHTSKPGPGGVTAALGTCELYVSPWISGLRTILTSLKVLTSTHSAISTIGLFAAAVRRLLPGRPSTYYEPELSDIPDDLYDSCYLVELLRRALSL